MLPGVLLNKTIKRVLIFIDNALLQLLQLLRGQALVRTTLAGGELSRAGVGLLGFPAIRTDRLKKKKLQ